MQEPKIGVRHIVGGAEIFLLAALPAWVQSPTGKGFLTQHAAIADGLAAAYVGFRAVQLALQPGGAADPLPPAPEPAETSQK